MMTPPLIKQLLSYGDTKITIASNILADAQALAAVAPKWLTAVHLDVKNISELEKMIEKQGKKQKNLSFGGFFNWLDQYI